MSEQPFMRSQPGPEEPPRPLASASRGDHPFSAGQRSADHPFMGSEPSSDLATLRAALPSVDGPTGVGRQSLWDDQPPPVWERDLDALVAPSLLVAPALDVQQAILAAVLRAAAETPVPVAVPALAATPLLGASAQAAPFDTASPARPISLGSYLLLAAVIVGYAAALPWVQGMFEGGRWVHTLAAQILAASEMVLGPLPLSEPMTLTWMIVQRAPWLALLPVAWWLWERDRASDSDPSSDPSTTPQAA